MPVFRSPNRMPPRGRPCNSHHRREQVVALVVTSGSTGVRADAPCQALGLPVCNVQRRRKPGHCADQAILGTVPPQHMSAGIHRPDAAAKRAALHAGRPFYRRTSAPTWRACPPARAGHHALPLRALLADSPPGPAVDQLVSATAPCEGLAMRPYPVSGRSCTSSRLHRDRQLARPTSPAPIGKNLAGVRLRREGPTLWDVGGHIDNPRAQ